MKSKKTNVSFCVKNQVLTICKILIIYENQEVLNTVINKIKNNNLFCLPKVKKISSVHFDSLSASYLYEGSHADVILIAANNQHVPPPIVCQWFGMLIGYHMRIGGKFIAFMDKYGLKAYGQYPFFKYANRIASALDMEFIPYANSRIETTHEITLSNISRRAIAMSYIIKHVPDTQKWWTPVEKKFSRL